MTIPVVQTAPQFVIWFPLFLCVGIPLFHACCLVTVVGSEMFQFSQFFFGSLK
jgi:hypothetical protein